jgi:hypothetical protein
MVWIIALLCLGFVGASGYYQGPVRAAFSFFGLLFGTLLAGALSPLTRHLLPLLGMQHPAWSVFVPQVLAFLIVLTIFKIAGQVVHQKIAVHFKYKVNDQLMYRWERVYARVGLCVGLLNGVFYFILLMLLIYSAGYFTTAAEAGAGDSISLRFLTSTRKELHEVHLDRMLASYDMVPGRVYQAAELGSLLLHNPVLITRLAHYPPCLELADRPDFKALTHDAELQQLIGNQAKVLDILRHHTLQTMLTNATIFAQVSGLLGGDLDDLQSFLTTGLSPKYDPETILGIWDINRSATLVQVRKKEPAISPKQLDKVEQELFPLIAGLSLTAMPNNQMILKLLNPSTKEFAVVAAGTWKKDQDTYQVNLPGSLPETSEVEIEQGNRLFLPKFGYVLAFDKEL